MQDNINKYSEKTNFGLMQMYPPKLTIKTEKTKDPKKKTEKKKKEKKKKKIKLHKCHKCKKKLTITEQQLTCKCGANFCPKHRLQQQHNCSTLNNFNKEEFKQKCGLIGGGKPQKVEVL